MPRRFRFRFLTAAVLFCATVSFAQKKVVPKPAYSIPLKSLGYREPLFERVISGHFPVTLNFFTANTVLFTFNVRGLLDRDAKHCDGPWDDDQVVRAALISLPDGKALAEEKWQLHDHNQYIWPVHDGVLMRRCHQFDLLQNSLTGNTILDFPTRPMFVQTSPDGSTIVVETQHEKHTPEEHERLMQRAIAGDGVIPAEDIDVNIISLEKRAALGKAQALAPIYVPISHDGIYETLPGQHNRWLINFEPFGGKSTQIAKVESTCHPILFPLAEDAFLVATCVSALNYHVVIAFRRDGKELWRDEWLNNLSRPVLAYAANNQRFAVATVHTLAATSGFGLLDESSAHTEDITVYSTYKGEVLLSIAVSPPYATGQNFALSPDGSQLAVINHGDLAIYDIPLKK